MPLYNELETEKSYHYLKQIVKIFHIAKNLSKEQLKKTAIAKSLNLLEEDGFKPQGFRYYKEIHYETRKELSSIEAEKTPTHNIFTMYVDPIVDMIRPSFKEIFGFTPADESFLTTVFKNNKHRKELQEFDKLIWLPLPEILLATKLKSVPNGTKDDKHMIFFDVL